MDHMTEIHACGRRVTIAYTESIVGDKEKATPVVLCHAFASSKDMLQNTLVKELKKKAEDRNMDMRIIAFDFPGHGDSDALESHTFNTLEESLVKFLDAIGVGKAHVFGMSMGGVVSLMHAARRPNRVMSLTVQGAPVDGKDFPVFLRFMNHTTLPTRFILRKLDFNKLCYVESFEHLRKILPFAVNVPTTMWFADLDDIFGDRMLTAIGMSDFRRVSSKVIFDIPVASMNLNLDSEFKAIRKNYRDTPVLLVDGSRKEHSFINTLTKLETELAGPSTKTLRVPGTGHFATILRPDVVARGLADTIKETESMFVGAESGAL